MKKTAKIHYNTVKVSFGMYLVDEVRNRTSKELPTETDIKKMLLKNPRLLPPQLSLAKQISRYCKTSQDYLLKAKEETLNVVAALLRLPVQHFSQFHDRINHLKRSSLYNTYIEKAENYMLQFKAADDEIYFKRLINYREDTGVKTILINYPFGELDANLPATHFGAYTDIKTEVLFKQLCTRMNVTNYKIMTDSVVVEQLEKSNKRPETLVSIGLFGNRLTASMLKKGVFGNLFYWLPEKNSIVLAGKQYAVNRSKKIDYGVFARLQLTNRKTILLVGGIEGYGTEKTGEYVWRNWRKISDIVTAAEASSVILLFKIFNGKIQLQKVLPLPPE